jgi:hypothetical protein
MRFPLQITIKAVGLMICLKKYWTGTLNLMGCWVASMMVMVSFKFVGVAAVLPPNLGSEVQALDDDCRVNTHFTCACEQTNPK